jgi:hypothetical protein
MQAARRLPTWARYGLALLGVAAVTGLIAALGQFHLANASMLHLAVVLLAAVALGRGPAVTAAVAAFLASNFFLVEPMRGPSERGSTRPGLRKCRESALTRPMHKPWLCWGSKQGA